MTDTNESYFKHYTNLQHVKHELVRQYLNGWLPILSSWNGRIHYIDTHAGRGRHTGGQEGSPLVAIRTLLEHSFRDRILAKCQVLFTLIEKDPKNYALLQEELAALGALPPKVTVRHTCTDSIAELQKGLADLRSAQKRLAPAFVFVDPFGYSLPGALLRDLLGAGRVEVFVNLMGRELDMAICNELGGERPTGQAEVLDSVFDGPGWRSVMAPTSEERLALVVEHFRKMLGARWLTCVRMMQGGDATKYLLLHATNHEAGRNLMKDVIWKALPTGDFTAYQGDDWRTGVMLKGEPDAAQVDGWVLERLARGPARWTSELHPEFLDTSFRATHLNDAMRRLRKAERIEHEGGRFLPKDDPVVRLR